MIEEFSAWTITFHEYYSHAEVRFQPRLNSEQVRFIRDNAREYGMLPVRTVHQGYKPEGSVDGMTRTILGFSTSRKGFSGNPIGYLKDYWYTEMQPVIDASEAPFDNPLGDS